MPQNVNIVQRTSFLVPKEFQVRFLERTSFLETLVHLLKGNIGIGLFTMGDAFKNSGYLLGFVGTLCIGSICIYNNHLLVSLSRRVKEHKKLPLDPTFPETISYAFELGPPSFSRIKNFIMILMKTCIVITQLGFCVAYITFVSSSLMTTIEKNSNFHLNIRYYMLATFIPVLAVSLIHTLKFLAPVSAISLLFVVYGCLLSIILSAFDLPHLSERSMVAPVERWPLFVGTVIFSFEGIALVVPLKNEMKKPQNFDSPFGVLNIGMFIVMNLLYSVGFVAYWKYGDTISGSVTFNLPNTWLAESVRIVVALGILLTYPLQFYVPVKLFLKDMKRRWGPFKYPLLVELALRTLLVIVTYSFSLALPCVNLVVSFIGAVCCNALALLFPALADISLRFHPTSEGDTDEGPKLTKNFFRLLMDVVSIILSILGAVFGLYVSSLSIFYAIKNDTCVT